MSAHFDGGAEIAGRRLREVVVQYVDDPTLNLDGEDSDSCPPSPPPTYYLRVREEKQCPRVHSNGDPHEERTVPGEQANGRESSAKAWAWRYVNVEKKSLLVWNRRGGKLLSSIPLADIASLRVISDEVSFSSGVTLSSFKCSSCHWLVHQGGQDPPSRYFHDCE